MPDGRQIRRNHSDKVRFLLRDRRIQRTVPPSCPVAGRLSDIEVAECGASASDLPASTFQCQSARTSMMPPSAARCSAFNRLVKYR